MKPALLKKLWIMCFTANPYRIKSFQDLYRHKPGEAIDNPESLSTILLRQAGAPIIYKIAPVTYNQDIPQQYINQKARFIYNGIFKEPERYLYSVTKGTVWGPAGLIYDAKQRSFIEESAKEWTVELKDSPFTNVIHFPPKTHLNGTALCCLTNGADAGFFHFLFEAIVKLQFAENIIKQVDHILFNGPETDWKLKWLERANVDTSKIVWTNNTAHYECEQLLFTSRLVLDQQISTWCINSLKNLFSISEPSVSASKKVIWITRKGLLSRNVTWEEQVLAQFSSIEKVDFSELSVEETIEKMQSATHVIAPHGAGLSNIFLCNKGTYILELFPHDALFKPCFHRLSTVCGLNHHLAWLNFNDGSDTNQGADFLKSLLTEFLCQA